MKILAIGATGHLGGVAAERLDAERRRVAALCSADRARRELDWRPSRPGAVDDLAHGSYALAQV